MKNLLFKFIPRIPTIGNWDKASRSALCIYADGTDTESWINVAVFGFEVYLVVSLETGFHCERVAQ